MEEMISAILERSNIENKEKLSLFLSRCIKASPNTARSTYSEHENVLFMTDVFFDELKKITNDVTNEKKFLLGVETLFITLEELGLPVEKQDAFIVYQLKDLGKFKIKDKKLLSDLKGLWGQYKEYTVEESDFMYTIKNLMRMGIVNYRKGNLNLKQSIVISYKND